VLTGALTDVLTRVLSDVLTRVLSGMQPSTAPSPSYGRDRRTDGH
jgi:hypothetical protein